MVVPPDLQGLLQLDPVRVHGLKLVELVRKLIVAAPLASHEDQSAVSVLDKDES